MDKLKLPFVMTVIGPKRVGKTQFIRTLLQKHIMKKFRYIVIFSPTVGLSGDFDFLKKQQKVRFMLCDKREEFASRAQKLFERLEELTMKSKRDSPKGKGPPVLLVLDDCGTEQIMTAHSILDDYSIRHRHVNLSILTVGHSFRGNGGLPKTLRLQSDYVVIFSPASTNELEGIIKDVSFSGDRSALLDAAARVYEKPYAYIVYIPSAPIHRRLLANFDTPLQAIATKSTRTKKRAKSVASTVEKDSKTSDDLI